MTAVDPGTVQAGACPVIHFEYAPSVGPGEDYFEQLDQARRTAPVFRSDEAQGYWVLAKNDLIVDALQQPEIFSSTATIPIFPEPEYKWIPLMVDPPLHTKWRKLLGGWFSPGRIAALEEPVRELSSQLIDQIAQKGSCDFVEDFAAKFPTAIFLRIIGLPVEELPKFLEWEEYIVHFSPDTDPDASKMNTAMAEVTAMFKGLIDQRRADPSQRADDIISAGLDWTIDGQPVSDADLLSCLLLLFMAGLDTVASQLSYIFRHLAVDEADRQAIVADPGRIPNAVEELLRYYSIVRVGRKVTQDVDFHGCPMKAGDMVAMPLAFASMDEAAFDNAGEIDISRSVFGNLAFGAGPHRCLGSHLARRELIVAVEEWHRRIPDYRITEGEQPREHSGGGVAGLDYLPLSWR